MSACTLSDEQKRKIEANKRKAQEKRAEKLIGNCPQTSCSLKADRKDILTQSQNKKLTQNPTKKFPLHLQTNKCAPKPDPCILPIPTSHSPLIATAFYCKQKLKGKCVLITRDQFRVDIGFSSPLIEYFKQIKTKSYDAASRTWSFCLTEYYTLMKGAKDFQPDIEIEGLPQSILNAFAKSSKCDNVQEANLAHVDDTLVNTLLPFQREGVNLAIHRKGRILIADDMGLGKTLQAICIACYYREEWPLLVVTPSSVRFDWAEQIRKWLPSVAPGSVNVVQTGKDSVTQGMINIISYDLLSKKADDLKERRFQVVIMDESHFLKNFKTVRTKAAMPIIKTARRLILLSGTPAMSRPSELFPQVIAVCPHLFKFHDFGVRYCDAKQHRWGWDYSGSSNMQELQLILEELVMIRRQKKDVLSQLPAKTRQVVFLDPSLIKTHSALKKMSGVMDRTSLKGLERRGLLLEYFRESCKAKLAAVRDYILDLVESQKKFLVFAHHKEMLDCIEDTIKTRTSDVKYIRIDGSTTSEQRHYFAQKFQTTDIYQVAILSITAANAGFNLSAASIVVFAELFWNPGILVQAEDRAHRIGQKDLVSVQYLIGKGTADDFVWPLVQGKLDVLSKAGLTKDDFSIADTKCLTDKSQQTIVDLFKSHFIDDTLPAASSTVGEENIKQDTIKQLASPQEHSKKVTTEKVSKRQVSIRSFVESSPHKKQKTELYTDCHPHEFENATDKSSQIAADELSAIYDVDWDEDM